MRTILKAIALVGTVVLLLIAALAVWQWPLVVAVADMAKATLEEPDWAAIEDEETLIQFMAAHKEQFGLVVQTIGSDGTVVEEVLAHRADEALPLASTVKIVVLSALARAVDEGDWTADDLLSTESWDSWYVQGFDGGAHPAAYDRLGIPHTDGHATSSRDVTVREVTDAMMRHSDNAATDLLIARLGERITAEAALLGHMPIEPLFHDMMAIFWPEETGDYRDESVRARLTSETLRPIKLTVQRSILGESMTRGTPRTYARIQAGVASRTWISPEASDFMASFLDWPMEMEWNAEEFDQLGTKGGSVPGVLTEATYMVPKAGDHGGEIRVGALFFHDLSGSAWFALSDSFAQQRLLFSLLKNDAAVERVVRALR